MSPVITNLLLKSLAETLYMLSVSAIIAALIGIPLGILLVVTEKHGILACPVLNKPLAFIINLIRSIPFIILMVAIIPFTRLVAGTSIGTTAAIVPLTIAASVVSIRAVFPLGSPGYNCTMACLMVEATLRPLAITAAARRSSIRELVQEPMNTRSN